MFFYVLDISSTSFDKQNSETQQLLASLEQHIAEPPPRVQPVPEDFWQQLETLTHGDDA